VTGIDDVARASGVSTATVSRALRGLPNVSAHTREAVRRAADELGYVPSSSASGLASGRTMAMGVVLSTLEQWYYATVIEGIDSVLRRASYDLILFNLGGRAGGERERVFHRSILRKRTDALIALNVDFTAEEQRQLTSTGHPTLIVGGSVRGLSHVGISEQRAARVATEHLIELGHRRIAHLAGEINPGFTKDVPVKRRRGYESALRDAGVPVPRDLAVRAGFTVREAKSAFATLLVDPGNRPTAVFADSDEMALGAMLAARDAGLRVPEDLSVVGIDDHPLAEPLGLTTVAQDAFKQGVLAAEMLLSELEDPLSRRRSVRYPVRLIRRSSTAPL
jgi:LacI family repressor for deo operon, udp, cdd, tsx, nupC, and nupG